MVGLYYNFFLIPAIWTAYITGALFRQDLFFSRAHLKLST